MFRSLSILLVLVFPVALCGQESFRVDAVLKISEERQIPCLTAGVIRESHVRESTLVDKGQLLMELDDVRAKLELSKLDKEAKMAREKSLTTVDVDYAEQTILVSQSELERAVRSNVRTPGSVSQAEIDQLTLNVEKAKAEKKKIEFQTSILGTQTLVKNIELEVGQQDVLDCQIYSPISGMVVEVFKKPGEWVHPGESVARVVQLDRLRTEIKVPAKIALDDLLGTRAIFTSNLEVLEGKQYEGRVVFVNPEANPVNMSVRVWVEIENKDLELVAGLTGELEILVGSKVSIEQPLEVSGN